MLLAANTKRGGDRRMENQPQDQLLKLEGVVEHMIYENAETGYAVFEAPTLSWPAMWAVSIMA